MAGIVKSSKKRILLDKKFKEIEIPTDILDTNLFFQDLNTVLGMRSQVDLSGEMTVLPSLVKNEATTVLVIGGYKEGVIYGYNGDTKSIEGFAFTRNSSATRINALGNLELIAENIPRVDYDPITKVVKGYLLEPAATNLLLYSGMGNYGSFQVVHPYDQDRTAFVTESNRPCLRIGIGTTLRLAEVNVVELKKYTYSFWIKAASSATLRILNYNTASYNHSTIEVTTSWQRITKTFETPVGTTMDILHLQKADASEMPVIFISDLQLEEGEIATSYIPTTNAATTRLSDTVTSMRPLENFPSSTLFVKGSWISGKDPSVSSLFIAKSVNSRFWYESAVGAPTVRTYNGSSSAETLAAENSELNLAVTLFNTGFKHCVNGAPVQVASGPFPNEALPLIIKGDKSILHLRALAIIPRELTDLELITLTV